MTVSGIWCWLHRALVGRLAYRLSARTDVNAAGPPISVAEVMRAPRRILLIPDGRPGGVFLAASRFFAIRRRYPEAGLDLLSPARRAYIAREIPFVDSTLVYDDFPLPLGQGPEVIGELRSRSYDVAFCFSTEDSICPSYLCARSGAVLRVGFQRHDLSCFNLCIVPRSDQAYEGERLSLLLSVLGIPEVKEGVSWSVSSEGARKIRDRYLGGKRPGERLLGIDISSEGGSGRGQSRFFPLAREVARRDNTRILLFFNYEDRKEANRIKAALAPKVLMFQNDDLPRMVALVEACDEILAGNSDLFHLASAMGRPVTAVIPAAQKIRWVPPGRSHIRVFDAETLSGNGFAEVRSAVEGRLDGKRDDRRALKAVVT